MHYKSCPRSLLTILTGDKDLGGPSQSLLFHTLSQCHVLNDSGVDKEIKSYKCILNETILKLSGKAAVMGGKMLSCIFMKSNDSKEEPFITTCP